MATAGGERGYDLGRSPAAEGGGGGSDQAVPVGVGHHRRAGWSRGPPVSSGRRRSRRASRTAGGRTATRAAASSIASGRPSRRRQTSATAAAVAAVRTKSGLAACAGDEEPDGLDLGEFRQTRAAAVAPGMTGHSKRWHREVVLAIQAQGRPADHQDFQPRSAAQ